MGLAGCPCLQRELDRSQHHLLIMMQYQSQYLDHLPPAAGLASQRRLQLFEGRWQLGKGSPIAQGTRFALYHRQVVVPVIDGLPSIMAAVDDSLVLTNS